MDEMFSNRKNQKPSKKEMVEQKSRDRDEPQSQYKKR